MVKKASGKGKRGRRKAAEPVAPDMTTQTGEVADASEMDKFDSLLSRLVAVPKDEIDRAAVEEHRRERPHR